MVRMHGGSQQSSSPCCEMGWPLFMPWLWSTGRAARSVSWKHPGVGEAAALQSAARAQQPQAGNRRYRNSQHLLPFIMVCFLFSVDRN